jgi:hypothetical protein
MWRARMRRLSVALLTGKSMPFCTAIDAETQVGNVALPFWRIAALLRRRDELQILFGGTRVVPLSARALRPLAQPTVSNCR